MNKGFLIVGLLASGGSMLVATGEINSTKGGTVEQIKELFTACACDDYKEATKTVERLLLEGVDPNVVFPDEFLGYTWSPEHFAKVTPLHYAVVFGDIEVVKLLLKAEANPNAMNKQGATPLHWATMEVHFPSEKIERVNLLLAAGADPSLKDKYGKTPLQYAFQHGHGEVMGLLLRAGGHVETAELLIG